MIGAIADTTIWLLDVPVDNGPVFLVLAVVGGLGTAAIHSATRRVRTRRLPGSIITNTTLVDGARPLLESARAREQLPRATPPAPRRLNLPRMLTGAMLVVLVFAGVLGILGTARVPVTDAYIRAHGAQASASVDDGWVTFTAANGRAYTLRLSAGSTDLALDAGAVAVRYLARHPQAYVITGEAP
ncbi:hypothetical protein [Gordonia hydrophobica]|uniref:Uncharacterized protein n=1 Tax=Gordonia hydrophobica TaxID=40516 RepID=A0ABZ2U6N8_9ACTN|nr:hypothetical protein [Gordonia hydrophobica]MBM7367510.1 ferric-dicitrate binding protein FerR (iron transport regulator) [Gordonia hydrophobica]